VDDEDDVRHLLRVNFDLDDRFEVLDEANNGKDGLALTIERTPDILLLDLMMPGMHGAEVLQEVKRVCPDTKIAMFTAATIGVAASLTGGEAHAYICKTDDVMEVMDKLARMAAGEPMILEHARGRIVRLS
jgi:DNA-binding NarL/FixJ family response regulator